MGNGGAGGAAGDADAHGPASADAQPALPGLAAPWNDAALPPRERRAKTLFINESYEVRSFAAHACHRLRLLCGPIASRTRIGKHERHGPGKVARRRRRLRRSSKTQTHTENSKPGCKTPTRVRLLWSVPPSLDLFLGKSNLITERDSPELR